MRTGRLLKFRRPDGDIHAYLYREGQVFRASVFVLAGTPRSGQQPLETLSGASEDLVEADLRAWVERHFPKPR